MPEPVRVGRAPARGTKEREILRRSMRPEGITAREAQASGLSSSKSNFWLVVGKMRDLRGWDLESRRAPRDDSYTGNAPTHAVRLVGCRRACGRYRGRVVR